MKDIGKVINKAYHILEIKKYKDADKYAFDTLTAKKILTILNSKDFANSGFDYKTCENILNFMAGQLAYVESRIEEPLFMQQNLKYMSDLYNSIEYLLNNMQFGHNGILASADYMDNINKKMHKTRFDTKILSNFNKRYNDESFAYINDCLGCN